MTFDFFNASNLAFGAKLTGAFTQLDNLAEAAESNLERVYYNVSIMEDYIGKNYLVAKPTSPNKACRTNEIFDLIDDIKYRLDTIEYKNNKLHIKAHIFNERNSRITVTEGETELKEGYAFYRQAKNNTYNPDNPTTEMKFVKEISEGEGELLFQYRIDNSGAININGLDAKVLGMIPFDSTQYSSLSKGETISGDYTANDYECLCIVGNKNNISVKLNGTEILRGYGNECVRHCIIYVKPDDKITGTYNRIFKINYNRR